MIPYLKNYEISIINYLKYEVLPVGFLEHIVNDPLVYDSSLGGYVADTTRQPDPTSFGRGWFPFDEDTVNGKVVIDTSAEQSNRISVNGATTYTIDYVNGVVKNPDSVPTSVSYYWDYISVIRGWPGTMPPPLPIVAIDVDQNQMAGFQLGGGTKDLIQGSVYIFATDDAEKKDISYLVQDAMFNKTLSIRNWHEGNYLDYDGTFNSDFTPVTLSGVGVGYFKEVTARMNGPRADWSELNRHRSRVDFEFEVFRV